MIESSGIHGIVSINQMAISIYHLIRSVVYDCKDETLTHQS